MRTKYDQIIEYIEKNVPLTDEETRILYKVTLLRALELQEKKIYKYCLETPAGEYYANNLFTLYWTVFKHRLWHLVKDGKWMD